MSSSSVRSFCFDFFPYSISNKLDSYFLRMDLLKSRECGALDEKEIFFLNVADRHL